MAPQFTHSAYHDFLFYDEGGEGLLLLLKAKAAKSGEKGGLGEGGHS